MFPGALSQLAEMGRGENLDLASIDTGWFAATKNGGCDNVGRRL
jgi:hypothetical protein